MNALFAHDHVFVRWLDGLYSPGRLPYAAFGRYLDHFENVCVVGRVREAESEAETMSLQRTDGPRLSFVVQPRSQAFPGLGLTNAFFRKQLLPAVARCDAVIARVPSRIGVLASTAARRLGKPLAVEVVQSAFHALWYHGSLRAKAFAPILDWQTRRLVERAEFALYVTQRYLQQRYPCSNTVASASNVVLPPSDGGALTRRLKRIAAAGRPLIVGFCGTLDARHKGLDTAMHALARVPRGFDWQFEVVGDGNSAPWTRLAKRLGIEHRVSVVGVLPGSGAVRSWLQSVDIYLQPSHSEGLPRSLIEAMSEGCAAVASEVSGIPELLTKSHLHPPGNAEALRAIVVSLMENSAAMEAAARANVAVARSYESDRLTAVRRTFYADFARFVAKRPGSSDGPRLSDSVLT